MTLLVLFAFVAGAGTAISPCVLPVLPALMLLWWQLFGLEWVAIATGPVVASLLPLSAFAALSYDGTAFAAELSAGVRGLHDRLGRAAALLIIAVPFLTVTAAW